MKLLLHLLSLTCIAILILVSCGKPKSFTEDNTLTQDSVDLVRVIPPKAAIVPNTFYIGTIPANCDTILAFSIQNNDSFEAIIDSIVVSLLDATPKLSWDSIRPGMIVAVGVKTIIPSVPGSYTCKFRIYSKDVSKPSCFDMSFDVIK